MGKLNAPRDCPYDFKVFEFEGFAWLFDDSSRTYICSQVPMIWAEPLYPINRGDEYWPDPNYFSVSVPKNAELFKVPLREEEVEASVSEEEAWDAAREEANGNCLV